MSDKTVEKVLEERIFNYLSAKFEEMATNTKQEINDLRIDTEAKIKQLSSTDGHAVAWVPFGSDDGSSVPDNNAPPKDDPSIFQLSQDVYSIVATASWRSLPFWISMIIIFGFQFTLLVLLLANQVDVNSDDNPLNLPANVDVPVRMSQVLLVIISLFSQDDLLVGIETLVDGFPDMFKGNGRFSTTTRVQWKLSAIIRLSQGLLNLLAAFVLSIQSETVPDVLLNVLGVGFISSLDDLAFKLSRKGYFGGSMKRIAEDLCEVQFQRAANKSPSSSSALATKVKGRLHIIITFLLLLAGIVAFIIFAVQQDIGMYSKQDVRIEFGDEVLPFLGLFNGCYKASDASENIAGRLVYEQVGYPNGGKFGFCSDLEEGGSGWVFYIGELQKRDICKNHVLRSGETSTFSLLEAAKTDWYTSDDLPLDSLEITETKLSSSECGQSMFEISNDTYCPSILAFDSMNMSRLPLLSVDLQSGRSLDASVSHTIYYGNETVGDALRFGLIFFTGRRWIRTSSGLIPPLQGNGTSLSDVQDFFFNRNGLFTLVDHLRASPDGKTLQWATAVSESVDTARDQGSPLGLQWYFPRYESSVEGTAEDENLQRNFPSANLARPMDSTLECLYCNGESNPCSNDGVCDNDSGTCACKYGTSGRLCQVLPLGNGICNLHFNNAEYNYDDGDCCAGTCVGERCGEDDLPNPFAAASMDLTTGRYSFSNETDEWKELFDGQEFAFGVDVVDNDIKYYDRPPLRFSHCEDPDTALLIVQQEAVSYRFGYTFWFWSTGTSVRCDDALYLRTPSFWFDPTISDTSLMEMVEKVRVPYGSNCEVTILYDDRGIYWNNFNVSLFAENQPVPFLQQEVRSVQEPIRLRIPESVCVWNTFVENRVDVLFTNFQDDGSTPGLSRNWNSRLSQEDYTSFTEGVNLDSICNKDSEELLERYAVWQISKTTPKDLSLNFYGHICDFHDESLDISCNGTRVGTLTLRNADHLSHEIGRLTSLTQLDLNGNQFTSLPSEIGQLTALTRLVVQDNQLTSLPSEIGNLTALTSLNVGGNQLASLPSEIGKLTTLEWLVMEGNQLTSLPPEVLQKWKTAKSLSLGNNQLTSLPSEIGKLTTLEWLFLEGNQLTSLPPEIGTLTALHWLYVNNNQLTSLPTEIGSLEYVRNLFLHRNQLTSLPTEIATLSSLRLLNLFYNPLTANSLPTEISNLTLLETLILVCGHAGDPGCSDHNCTDNVGWLDAYETGCDRYEAFGCERADYRINDDGISANEACCICGGGTSPNEVQLCRNSDWVDEDGCGCDEYDFNPEWCALYGAFVYEGESADQACCACGGGTPILLDSTEGTDPPILIGQKNCILSPPLQIAPGLTVENWVDHDGLEFRMRFVYQGKSWIGLSFENDGYPGKPTFAVIGRKESESDSFGDVKKYFLNSANPDASGVIEMGTGSQTLEDASFIQTTSTSTGSDTTIMEFTKPMNEIFDNPQQIVSDRVTWIYAVGLPNNAWQGGHAMVGKFNLAMKPCFTNPWILDNPSVNGGVVDMNNKANLDFTVEKPNQFLWIVHGISLVIAWGIVAPIALGTLWLKRKGPRWSKLNQFCNTATLLITCAGILLGVIATFLEEDVSHLRTDHSYYGVGVFGGLLLYSIMALSLGAARAQKEKQQAEQRKVVVPPSSSRARRMTNNNGNATNTRQPGMGNGMDPARTPQTSQSLYSMPPPPRWQDDNYNNNGTTTTPPEKPGIVEWCSRLLFLACIGVAYYTCQTGADWQLDHWDLDWESYYVGVGVTGGILCLLLITLSYCCCLPDDIVGNEKVVDKSKTVSLGAQDSMVGLTVEQRTFHNDNSNPYEPAPFFPTPVDEGDSFYFPPGTDASTYDASKTLNTNQEPMNEQQLQQQQIRQRQEEQELKLQYLADSGDGENAQRSPMRSSWDVDCCAL